MKPIFVMMCGLPASGKSTLADTIAKEYNMEVFSSDSLRAELFGDVNEQSRNEELFTELHKHVKDCLRSGKNTIYDACNCNYKKRKHFLSELKNIPCKKVCVIVATSYKECIKRSHVRERKVPEHVIKRMYLNWNTPYWFEGWDDIIIHGSYQNTKLAGLWLRQHQNYDQNNSHHTLTLGEHCYAVGDKLKDDPLLRYSGFLHDIGKPFVKSYINSKGETTTEAHYYQHHCCGAYDSLFYCPPLNVNILDVSILINLHMMPYFWEKDKVRGDKTCLKYKRLWGDKLYESVMKLHDADKEAH